MDSSLCLSHFGESLTFIFLTIPAIYLGHSSGFSIETLIFLSAKFDLNDLGSY